MKKLFVLHLFFAGICFPSLADSQFKQSVGFPDATSEFLSICETPDSGYVLLGNVTDTTSARSKIFMVKMTFEGTLVWSRTYEYAFDAFGIKVAAAGNGELVVMGYSFLNTPPYDDIFLIRTQSDGTILWSTTYGGNDIDEGNDMIVDNQGNIVIAGYTYSFGSALKSAFAIKTDGGGSVLWSRTYAQNVNQEFNGIIQCQDNGYFLCGFTQAPPGINFDGYMVKTDSLGNPEWSKRTGGSGSEILYRSMQDAAGDFYIAGSASTNTLSGNIDGWLLKVSANGNANSINYTYGSPIADRTYGIASPPGLTSSLFLSGYSLSSSGYENALLLPVNASDGSLSGSALLAGTNTGNARAMASVFSSTGLVQAGYIFTAADTLGSAYVVKYPTTISPCQVGIANPDLRDQTQNLFYTDSAGTDTVAAFAAETPVTFSSTVVNPGQNIFCIILGEEDLESETTVTLFPNPAAHAIRLDVGDGNQQELTIVDLTGRVFLSTRVSGRQEISVAQLPPGMYQIQLERNGKLIRKKFIRSK
jgi:hypothetical protein